MVHWRRPAAEWSDAGQGLVAMKSNLTVYSGVRPNPEHAGPLPVWVCEAREAGGRKRELKPGPSQRLFNHSPDGFQWGYGGSGPSQLALAILLDFTEGDGELALHCYQDFKFQHVAGFGDEWQLSGKTIRCFIENHLAQYQLFREPGSELEAQLTAPEIEALKAAGKVKTGAEIEALFDKLPDAGAGFPDVKTPGPGLAARQRNRERRQRGKGGAHDAR
jgi:hypothetical protein